MNKIIRSLSFFITLLFLTGATATRAQQSTPPRILSMQERAEVQDRWQEYRLNTVVPRLMRREQIDM
ncbi:MAG: hypothetical protein R3281_09855 [Balneolaceae bacterium]|nr:hypothetical protein [Balneolaceae bacterium]